MCHSQCLCLLAVILSLCGCAASLRSHCASISSCYALFCGRFVSCCVHCACLFDNTRRIQNMGEICKKKKLPKKAWDLIGGESYLCQCRFCCFCSTKPGFQVQSFGFGATAAQEFEQVIHSSPAPEATCLRGKIANPKWPPKATASMCECT